MRLIIAYLPTMIGLIIVAIMGFYWAEQERKDPDRYRRRRR